MIIYSDVALTFLREVRAISLKIIKFEMGLPFERKRLKYKGYLYPLDFVVFEHPTILGQYIPGKYQIQINKSLIYRASPETLENILRHEICHYLTHIQYGDNIEAHGPEFHATCDRFNYKKDVSSATIEIEKGPTQEAFCDDKVFKKVKKLFQLASSDNSHEAELATIKANNLLRQHHLSPDHLSKNDHETVLLSVLNGKKVTPKHESIYEILKEFLVAPVFNYQRGSFQLEVIGERTNVLTADYVAKFLDFQLELLYSQEKKKNLALKGPGAKRSFMRGIAQGFLEKIKQSTNQEYTSDQLVACQQSVSKHLERAYPRLKGRSSKSVKDNPSANQLGKNMGRNLTINPGLKNNSNMKLIE